MLIAPEPLLPAAGANPRGRIVGLVPVFGTEQVEFARLGLAITKQPDHLKDVGPRGEGLAVALLELIDRDDEEELLGGQLAFFGGTLEIREPPPRAPAPLEPGDLSAVGLVGQRSSIGNRSAINHGSIGESRNARARMCSSVGLAAGGVWVLVLALTMAGRLVAGHVWFRMPENLDTTAWSGPFIRVPRRLRAGHGSEVVVLVGIVFFVRFFFIIQFVVVVLEEILVVVLKLVVILKLIV